jgi:hypothetical protein
MLEQERKDRISLLERKKKGFEQNKNISILVICLLGYDTWKSSIKDKPEWYFFLLMFILMLALTGIIIRDFIQIKKINAAIQITQNNEEGDSLKKI